MLQQTDDLEGQGICYSSYWRFASDKEPAVYPFCIEDAKRFHPFRYLESNNLYLLIILMKEGTLHYRCGSRTWVAKPGRVLVLPRFTRFCFETPPGVSSYHKIVMEIKGRLLEEYQQEFNFMQPRIFTPPDTDALAERILEIGEIMQENNPAAGAQCIGKTVELLYSTFAIPQKKEESPILNAALSYISAHLESPVDITGLCRSVGVSKSTLARIFAANGLAVPSKYWRNRTLQLATFLLLNTDMSMKEIAFKLGFASQFHFSRVFAENVGKSPREFRKTAFR